MLALLLATAPPAWADSDTWTGATNGNWHTAGNWEGGSIPNAESEIASFGASTNTDVSISQGTTISGITFNEGADSFTISQTTAVPMTFDEQGVINNSDVTQTFEIAPWLYLEKMAFFDFRGNATAGNKTEFVFAGADDDFLIGGWSRFYDDASAGSAVFKLNGANTDLGMGGRVDFYQSSTASDATFWLYGNKGIGNDPESVAGTLVAFHDTTTAGNAEFNLSAGLDPLSRGSILSFQDDSSAENATINVHALPFGVGQNASVIFEENSTADNATVVASAIMNGTPGLISFYGEATGGTATIELRGGELLINDVTSSGVSIGSLEGDSTSRVEIGSKKLTIGTNNKSTIMRGVLEGEGGSLAKTGTGMLTLTGDNTYTGVTSVTGGGELRVTGSLVGDTELNFGATLSGTGTLAAVTAGLGAVVAPGPGAGTLHTGDLTLVLTAQINFDLASPGTVGSGVNDLIVIEGDLVLDGNLTIADPDELAEGTYTLITYTGALTDNGLTLANPADGFIYSIDTTQANAITLQVVSENASLDLSVSLLNFGVRPYHAAAVSRVLDLTNDGNVAVSVAGVSLSGLHASEFVVTSDTCSATTLAVAAQCSVTLDHEGDTVGVRAATFTLQSDAGNSPHEVTLSARLVAEPVLSGLHGAALEFRAGAGPVLFDPDAQAALSLPGAQNLAGATLRVELISGASAEDDLLSFSTAGDISLSASMAGSEIRVDGVVIGTLDSAISAGEVLGVTFNDNATPVRIQLLLQALTYRNINTNSPVAGLREIRIELTYLGQLASATLNADVIVSRTLNLSVTEMGFGMRAYNAASTSRSFTVENSGNVPVNLAASVLSGPDAGDFVIATDTCSESTLAVAAQCAITISHEGNIPGVRNATLRLTSDADGSPHEVTLSARVVGEPVFQNLNDATRIFITGGLPMLLDAGLQLSVPGAESLISGGLSVEILTGADVEEDMLAIAISDRVTLAGTDPGAEVLVDGVVIGMLANMLAPGDLLVVIFKEGATPALVQVLLQHLTFQNVNDTDPVNGVRDIRFTLGYLDMVASVDMAVDVQPPPPPPPSGGGNITTEVVDQTLNGNVQIGAGGVINGGTINGNVAGNGEITGDVVMGAGASISGAIITGNISGNAAAPARLRGGTVTGDAVLSNVVIAPDVVLEPGLTLGEGVTFESPGLIDAVQSIDVFDAGGATVTQLANGQITVSGDGYQAVTLPVAIVQAQTGQAPGVYLGDNGDILLITADGLGIRAYARHADSASLQSMMSDMSLQITFTPSGQMLVSPGDSGTAALTGGRRVMALQADETYFSARPDVLAIPAHRGDAPGLLEYPVMGLGTVLHVSSLFVAGDGALMQQDLVPTPVDWFDLKATLLALSGVTTASMDTRGTIQVSIDGINLRGVMDYAVTRGGPGNTEGLTLNVAGDLTGNGMDDYRVTYANGDQQLLFVYQLE